MVGPGPPSPGGDLTTALLATTDTTASLTGDSIIFILT